MSRRSKSRRPRKDKRRGRRQSLGRGARVLLVLLGVSVGAAFLALGVQEARRFAWESKRVEVVPEAEWGGEGEAEGRFREPWGLARDPSGNLIVADFNNHRIQFFDPRGRLLKTLGRRGKGPGEFEQPCDVHVDPDGTLYVCDTFNHRIQKFSAEGRFLLQWSRSFFGPRGITGWKDRIYVVDTGNHKMQSFDRDGRFLREWGGPGEEDGRFREPVGCAVDPQGVLYVADTDNRRVQKFDADGKWLASIAVPTWEGKSAEMPYLDFAGGFLYVGNSSRGAVLKMTPEGRVTAVYVKKGEGGFGYTAGVAVDAGTGRVYVAEKGRHRVSAFREPPNTAR